MVVDTVLYTRQCSHFMPPGEAHRYVYPMIGRPIFRIANVAFPILFCLMLVENIIFYNTVIEIRTIFRFSYKHSVAVFDGSRKLSSVDQFCMWFKNKQKMMRSQVSRVHPLILK